jgi:LysM repeat protein
MPTSKQDFSSVQPPSLRQPVEKGKSETEVLAGQHAITGGRRRSCPSCYAPIQAGQSVCTACGSHLKKRPEVIRCRYCKGRASSQLVVCPGCGRELQPAGSALLSVGLPGALVVLLALVLIGRFGFDPFNWAEARMAGGLQMIENIAITPVRMDETTTDSPAGGRSLVALRPLPPAAEQNRTANPDVSTGGVDAAPENEAGDAGAVESSTQEEAVEGEVQAASTETEVVTGTAAGEPEVVVLESPAEAPAAEAPADTPAPAPTETPAPTATDTPASSPTNTPVPVVAEVPTATPTDAASGRTLPLDSDTGGSAEMRSLTETSAPESTAAESQTDNAPAVIALPTVVATATPAPMARYTVKSGDTLVGVAARFGIPTDELMIANGLTSTTGANLAVGRVLLLPGVISVDEESSQTYVVQAGETFVGIALRFNVPTEALLKANGLSENDARTLQVGQVIVIPPAGATGNSVPVQVESIARPTATPTAEAIQYTVRSGDTVVSIARRHGTTTQTLLRYNNLTEARARTLKPGDILYIPRSQ